MHGTTGAPAQHAVARFPLMRQKGRCKANSQSKQALAHPSSAAVSKFPRGVTKHVRQMMGTGVMERRIGSPRVTRIRHYVHFLRISWRGQHSMTETACPNLKDFETLLRKFRWMVCWMGKKQGTPSQLFGLRCFNMQNVCLGIWHY